MRVRGIRARLGASQRNENEMINGHLRLANVEFGVGRVGAVGRGTSLGSTCLLVCLFVCLFTVKQPI